MAFAKNIHHTLHRVTARHKNFKSFTLVSISRYTYINHTHLLRETCDFNKVFKIYIITSQKKTAHFVNFDTRTPTDIGYFHVIFSTTVINKNK